MGSWRYEHEIAQLQALPLEESKLVGGLASTQDQLKIHAPAYDGKVLKATEASKATEATEATVRILHEQSAYALWDAYDAFSAYLNLSIDDILASDNPLIRVERSACLTSASVSGGCVPTTRANSPCSFRSCLPAGASARTSGHLPQGQVPKPHIHDPR